MRVRSKRIVLGNSVKSITTILKNIKFFVRVNMTAAVITGYRPPKFLFSNHLFEKSISERGLSFLKGLDIEKITDFFKESLSESSNLPKEKVPANIIDISRTKDIEKISYRIDKKHGIIYVGSRNIKALTEKIITYYSYDNHRTGFPLEELLPGSFVDTYV
ncbi:hypothetical protein GOV13_04495 [Candidatus Pacearchaeota archaeon]|nr:hypothetical protein [Candidatus Pacearchaeota archaeon]